MCGIAGYIRPQGLFEPERLTEMIGRLQHRGPDGIGTWTSPQHGLALGHARLKIQDLTQAAEQPMHTDDGSGVLTFNGEIYNFHEIRERLRADGAVFRSTGDTAVLLELCRRDPSLAFLPTLNGMFAFAFWDLPSRTLTMVRDRTGVKPLLWAALPGGGLAFGSEMSSLRPVVTDLSIRAAAVTQLLSLGFIAAPGTIFHQIQKLRPGHLLRYRDGQIEVRAWAPAIPSESPVEEFEQAKSLVRGTVEDAVRVRLIADVPVGVFLSGGIDSAIVTAVASKVSGTRVKTFSVAFPNEPFFDESRYARAVADMHGTEHTTLPLSLREIQDVIPIVQAHIGEPFADSSALPSYLLSKLTRQHITVALSGDGADELFAGYNRYAAATLLERYGWFSRSPIYGAARGIVGRLPVRRETRVGGIISQMKRAIRSMDRDRRMRYANWMRTSDDRTFARLLQAPATADARLADVTALLWEHRGEPKDSDNLNSHLMTEWRLSLPDDMLTKVDLMSMAHGLEVRSPFLDYRLVDAVAPMDWRWKLKGWKKKHLLIESFRDMLPQALHDRPKKGFEVPVGPWLRGPLRGWAEALIRNDRCLFGTLLNREGALDILADHAAGRADHNFCLWALVSLLSWQQNHAPNVAVADELPPP